VGRELAERYDLVIVGVGPAGAVAALHASRHGATVLMLQRNEPPGPYPQAGWLGPAGVALCQECGVTAKPAGAAEFAGLRLHSWDLKRSVLVEDRELRGWLVSRAAFDEALWKQAVRAGAVGLVGVGVQDLDLGEDWAVLHLSDGRQVAGQIVLIDDGVASPTTQMANLACAAEQPAVPQGVFASFETDDADARLDVALGASRAGQLATAVRLGNTVYVRMMVRASEEPIEQQFRAFCEQGVRTGLLPGGAPAEAPRHLSPAGIALDMDTHVGKRCLLIGEAGGFVAAFSNEAVYPAMRSGWIAADVALRALKVPVLQDELASFGVAWRGELADYLRMPSTDLGLLMPLVFNNEQVSRRVARAFLLGRPF
jgi:flavin-dependent dehydrogenase